MLQDVEEIKKFPNDAFFWNKVTSLKNACNELMFPNLRNLVSGIMALPHSSAAAESIFTIISHQNKNQKQIRDRNM